MAIYLTFYGRGDLVIFTEFLSTPQLCPNPKSSSASYQRQNLLSDQFGNHSIGKINFLLHLLNRNIFVDHFV